MAILDRSGITTAIRLLAKAESTDSDDEARALALRSYSLLAQVINTYELADGGAPRGARRRERRLLSDRRANTLTSRDSGEQVPGVSETTAARYARLGKTGASPEGAVDLSL
jgi:hypothetical protein